MRILIGITGSISAYKSAELASQLVKKGDEVQCMATANALSFIGPAALEGITRNPVKKDMFEHSDKIEHITLSDWADLILLYPASAAAAARLRMGLAEDLISAVFLANNFRKPFWIAPAMNSNMLEHPAVQENLSILSSWGARVLPTEEGLLACGTRGSGRLISPSAIVEYIEEIRS